MASPPIAYAKPGLPTAVTIYEVGARDGLQAERTMIPVETKLSLINRLGDAGLTAIEATSFVSPRWVPQLADADELMARLVRRPGVRYPVLVPNHRGMDRALAAGAAEVAVFVSATETFAQQNLGTSVQGALALAEPVLAAAAQRGMAVRGYVSMAFGDPWEGAVATEQVARVAARLVALGCRTVSLGDTIGVATAGQVAAALKAVLAAGVAREQLALHFHDAYGQALANVLAGVAEFDASAGGLGGCPYAKSATGNLATEDLVWLLDGLGIAHGVDLASLVATSVWLAGELGRPSPSRGRHRSRAWAGALGSGATGEVTVAEIDDFDIDRSIAQAWADFQARLSDIISVIDDSGDLTIGSGLASGDPGPFVRFSGLSGGLVRCEAAGNPTLGPDFRLEPAQEQAMVALGWCAPEVDQNRPHFWAEGPQEDSDRLSELAVAALRDVYGVQHPVFLAPDQLAEILQPAPTPIEPAAQLVPTRPGSTLARSRSHLDELIDTELTAMYGHPPIRDEEGDVAIRVGSTMLFLRTSADGQEVMIFSAVVHDVSGRSRAAEVLNDLNVAARWVKFQLVRDRVFVNYSMLARPFVPAHLHQAVQIVSEVADGIDDELAAKLHGRTTFTDRDDQA